MKPYEPLGMIKGPQPLRRNKAGGLYVPVSLIGAANKPLPNWERGLVYGDTLTRLSISSQVTLRPNTYDRYK